MMRFYAPLVPSRAHPWRVEMPSARSSRLSPRGLSRPSNSAQSLSDSRPQRPVESRCVNATSRRDAATGTRRASARGWPRTRGSFQPHVHSACGRGFRTAGPRSSSSPGEAPSSFVTGSPVRCLRFMPSRRKPLGAFEGGSAGLLGFWVWMVVVDVGSRPDTHWNTQGARRRSREP